MAVGTRARVEGAAGALAFALHAAVVVAVSRHAPPVPDVAPELSALELEIVVLEPATAEVLIDEGKVEHLGPQRGRAARARPPAPRVEESGVETFAPAEYAVDPRAPSLSAAGEERRRAVTFDLPAGAPPLAERDAPAVVATEDATTKLRRSFAADKNEHDRHLGLGVITQVGGQVVAAAQPAIQRAGAPDGWAVLDVALDGGGRTRAVALASSSTAGFGASVDAVREALGQRVIALPSSFRAGARVRIKIVSRVRRASGQKGALEASNLFKPSNEPGRETQPKVGMVHERWWRDALPGLPIWDKIQPPLNGRGVTVPVLDFDVTSARAAESLSVAVTVMDVVPE